MNTHQCYICGLMSNNGGNIKKHMKIDHNVQVESEVSTEEFCCSQCSYVNENMEEVKKHLIDIHKKDEWNWSLDINMRFECHECDLEFASKSMLRTHLDSDHKEVCGIVVKDVATNLKVEPNKEFLTQNTKDLEEMLRNIPQ